MLSSKQASEAARSLLTHACTYLLLTHGLRFQLTQALEQSGLAYVAVAPADDDAAGTERPDSPPPLSELFPEMRCSVFEIRTALGE